MLNKAGIVDRLYENQPPFSGYGPGMVSKYGVEQIVDSVFQYIIDGVNSVGEVSIAGFGKFRLHKSEARLGRNPKTGEQIEIGAKMTPKFRASEKWRREMSAGV